MKRMRSALTKKEKDFIKTVWEFYKTNGRRSLPWRKTTNPYRILVSEVMLQQTQVDRVILKYKAFLKLFPTVKKLSEAPLGQVLRAWQGLGYNRRAKMLHECAKTITQKCRGRGAHPTLPRSYEELVKLPGVGPYTAGAIMAFAYNKPVSIIETNIRTVMIHHFFNDEVEISDQAILRLTVRSLDTENPREWYYALMDYGAYLKKTVGNQNVRSKHYVKQSTFKNSDRQIRGAILRRFSLITIHSKASPSYGLTRRALHTELPFEIDRIDAQLERLKEEGMVIKIGQKYTLPV